MLWHTVDGSIFVGDQFSWFSWRVWSTNSSTHEMVIFGMNYEGTNKNKAIHSNWAEILHMTFFYCTTDQVWVWWFASIFVGVMPLLELRILEIHSFLHFFLTCFDMLSWNFAYNFFLLHFRLNFSDVNLRQFLWE